MAIMKFSDWKRAVFRCGKEIKGLRGGVHRYAAQVNLQIDAATAGKSRFRMEASSENCRCFLSAVRALDRLMNNSLRG